MDTMADQLILQLTDMETKFTEMVGKACTYIGQHRDWLVEYSGPYRDGYVWADLKSYQRFLELSTDCEKLFNEAERFLAQRYSKYRRLKTVGKFEAKSPRLYNVRCLGLIEDLNRARNSPALPMTQNVYLCR